MWGESRIRPLWLINAKHSDNFWLILPISLCPRGILLILQERKKLQETLVMGIH